MANPYLTNLADLRALETRLDQRLDLLSKAEQNLKGLLEALRHQVSSAYPVLEQLKKAIPDAAEAAEAAKQSDPAPLYEAADRIADQMTAQIFETIEKAKSEIGDIAGPIRQQMIDELRAVTLAAKANIASTDTKAQQESARSSLKELADSFQAEARLTLQSMRQSMMDQVDLLKSESTLQIQPILQQINTARVTAEAQIGVIVDAQQSAMQYRVEQLSRGIEEIAGILEERLTGRVQAMQRRADDTIAAIEPVLQSRVNRAIEQANQTTDEGLLKLQNKINIMQPRLMAQINQNDQQLTQRLERLESHAMSMCSYLESKLTAHVDELIQNLRLKLHQELSTTTGAAAPLIRTEPMPVQARPTVEVDLYVRNQPKSSAA